MCPALSGSMGEKTRAVSGAPQRWMRRGFMSMVRETMGSVGLTVILTPCLWPTFLRVSSGQMLGLAFRGTRIQLFLGTQWASLNNKLRSHVSVETIRPNIII